MHPFSWHFPSHTAISEPDNSHEIYAMDKSSNDSTTLLQIFHHFCMDLVKAKESNLVNHKVIMFTLHSFANQQNQMK